MVFPSKSTFFQRRASNSPMRIPVRTAIRTRVRPGSSKALRRRDTSSVVKNRNCPRSGLGGSLTPLAPSQSDIQSHFYGSPEFQKKFPHNLGFITLSGVGFNPTRTQAVFYIDHFCGLCGGGRYVLMEKINGSWRVLDEHSTWIS